MRRRRFWLARAPPVEFDQFQEHAQVRIQLRLRAVEIEIANREAVVLASLSAGDEVVLP